jgi:glycine/D-amino acid oxidase-like deaminating enzyme
MHRALADTVDEVGRVAAAEHIDCHWAKGGTLTLDRSQAQLRRARAAVASGFDLTFLDAASASARCGASGVLGATYNPHCAAIHPARLVRGLAEAVAYEWGGPLGVPRDWMPSVGLRGWLAWGGGYVSGGARR